MGLKALISFALKIQKGKKITGQKEATGSLFDL